jgi:hypothetical protein
MMLSSFPDSGQNMMAVASNDINATPPFRHMVLVSHGSVLFALESVLPALVSHGSEYRW